MKIEKNSFKKVLSKIGICVGKTKEDSLIAFENKSGKLKLVATDLNNIVSYEMTGDETEDMSFVIDYKSLTNACKIRGKEIDFKLSENNLYVSDENTTFDFAVSSIDEFPFQEHELEDKYLIVKTKELQQMIKHGSFVRNEKDSKKFVTGVLFTLKEGILTSISTDCKRLAKSFLEVEEKQMEFSCVLTSKCIEAIKAFESQTLNIRMNDKVVNIVADGYSFYMKKLECDFPETSKFFNEEEHSQYIINRNNFIESFDLMNTVDENTVCVKFEENKAQITSIGLKNSVKDIVVCEKKVGEDFEFRVNKELFLQILKNLDEQNIVIKYKDSVSPIEYNDLKNSRGVIMPVKKN